MKEEYFESKENNKSEDESDASTSGDDDESQSSTSSTDTNGEQLSTAVDKLSGEKLKVCDLTSSDSWSRQVEFGSKSLYQMTENVQENIRNENDSELTLSPVLKILRTIPLVKSQR